MIDRTLTVKLFFIMLLLSVMLYHSDTLFDDVKEVFSTYSQTSFMVASACLGVIFSASIYNAAFYLYNRDKRYLYYFLAQWSILLFLVTLDSLYIAPFVDIFSLDSFMLHDMAQIFIVIFSLLFIKEFLDVPQNTAKLDMLIRIILWLMWVELVITFLTGHGFLIRLIPVFIFIWLVVSESKRYIVDKDKAFWFFYYGWYLVIIMSVLVYMEISNYVVDNFPFLHITLAVEAMIMSLVISYQVKLSEDEKKAQQSLLLQQSRLASMGEMVATIAHQWRQPLTHLSYILMNVKKNQSDQSIVEAKLKEANYQIQYMSQTINDFRNFYNPSKVKELFNVSDALQSTLNIVLGTLKNVGIDVYVENVHDFKIEANKNELEQAFLNIINNARDALLSDKIINPKIEIIIEKPYIKIKDNAKGIPAEKQSHIFEPYVSSKKGSDGIGLYISKTIIEKEMGGKLLLQTGTQGSVFILKLV